MFSPSEWTGTRELRVIYLLLYYRRSVIIMSICALRMYRRLVDSAALNGPLEGAFSATEYPKLEPRSPTSG
jgi:hypothetical protein